MEKFEKHQESLVEDIKKIFEGNLVSVILYGSYVRGGYLSGKSDINLMILRKKRDNRELIGLNKLFRKYFRKLKIALPLVLTLDEIQSSTDVYPMEYQDIKDHHTVLYGQDTFNKLKIEKKNLRLELENQVKSRLIHLRESLIQFHNRKRILKMILLGSVSSMIVILKNILKLNNQEPGDNAEDLLASVEEKCNLKLPGLEKVLQYRRGSLKLKSGQIISLYLDQIKEFETLADYVDRFKIEKKK
jgi:predicted nucleotidyltransferase